MIVQILLTKIQASRELLYKLEGYSQQITILLPKTNNMIDNKWMTMSDTTIEPQRFYYESTIKQFKMD